MIETATEEHTTEQRRADLLPLGPFRVEVPAPATSARQAFARVIARALVARALAEERGPDACEVPP
jgi:hypothetical protein